MQGNHFWEGQRGVFVDVHFQCVCAMCCAMCCVRVFCKVFFSLLSFNIFETEFQIYDHFISLRNQTGKNTIPKKCTQTNKQINPFTIRQR